MNRLTRPELRAAIVPAFGGLIAVLDATIVAVALPQLMAAFGTSLTAAQWITTAYPLAMVATMPLAAGPAARWGAGRAPEAATIVDAQRLTRVAALIVMSLALVVRSRAPRRTPVILDRQDSSANVGHTP